ncbi:MAG: type III secretion system inner membrane ring subunit SctD [Pseudomonadota bacterium]
MMLQTSDDAFAIAPEDQIVLRVLSGVQLGAEMSLMPAEYVIGSGDEADIILADGALKWKHAGVTVDSEGATIEAIEGSVNVAGERLDPGKRRQLELPATLVIGLLIIGVGKQTTDWSQIELPDVRENAGDAESGADGENEDQQGSDGEDASETEDQDAEARKDADQSGESEEDAEGAKPNEAEETDSAPEDQKKKKSAAPVIVGTTLAVALLLGVGGYALYQSGMLDGSGSNSGGGQEVVLTPEDRIREVITSLGLKEVEVGDPVGLGLTISGYVDTYEEHDALIASIDGEGLEPLNRVRIVEKMLDTLTVTLASVDWPEPNYEQHLIVTHEGDGRIVIDGYLGPEVDRSSLRRRLESDVPGISFLRFTRSDLRSWRSIMIDMIEDAKLSDWLTTSPDGANIRVDGELTARQAKTWQKVGERFTVESRGRPRVTIGVTALPDWDQIAQDAEEQVDDAPPAEEESASEVLSAPESVVDRFDATPVIAPAPTAAPIVSIIPRPNFVVIGIIVSDEGDSIALLSNGSSIRAGDRFDSGAFVTEVSSDRVTVKAGDNTYTYQVRRR